MHSENKKTVGEIIFEKYLDSLGYKYIFEKEFSHTSQKPDYSVTYLGSEYLFEVKDIENSEAPHPGSFGFYNPYAKVRRKINKARDKFKAFRLHPCGLVLCDVDGTGRQIHWPETIQGAMFGDLALQVPVPAVAGASEESAVQVFTDNGKMIQPHWTTPENTTICVIIVISPYLSGDLGMRIYENPFAKKPLQFPREMFSGNFDEIYGESEGYYNLLYQGLGLKAYL